MFKISHEVPVAYLEESLKFNDYDYLLPHLYDQNEEYRDFFRNNKDRYVVMDNSLHELGHAYDTDRMMAIMEEVEPNEFIVPDVWQDSFATKVNAMEWSHIELPTDTIKVAVAQGNSIAEYSDCIEMFLNYGYDKVAITYGNSFLSQIVPHPNYDMARALGRMFTVGRLAQKGYFTNAKVHLLGCAIPQEFGWYNTPEYSFIDSIDTSNPVMAAFDGMYYEPFGLTTKPKTAIDKVIEDDFEFGIFERILFNVNQFRNLSGYRD